jgi:predicted HD phosphohydrolase
MVQLDVRAAKAAAVPLPNGHRRYPLRSIGEVGTLLAAGSARPHPEIYSSTPTWAESVDLLNHALQCAELLAAWRPLDEELQVAGLLHDLAHHDEPCDLSSLSDRAFLHGAEASARLEPLFGQRVARLIALHVPAERYLVTFDADYGPGSGRHSLRSMDLAGGPMSREEVGFFEGFPEWTSAITLRRADDLSIGRGICTRELSDWFPTLGRVAERCRLSAALKQAQPSLRSCPDSCRRSCTGCAIPFATRSESGRP